MTSQERRYNMVEFTVRSTGKKLCALSLHNLPQGEIEATKERLAKENKLKLDEVMVTMKFTTER